MRVRVYAPAFADHTVLDENSELELPDNALLRDLYRALKIPVLLRPIPMCLVNYEWSRRSRPLCDGDVVSFFSVGQGG